MTAEQCIKEANGGYPLRIFIDNLTDEQIIEVIKDYAKYHVKKALKDAAEKAEIKIAEKYHREIDFNTYEPYVDKESILNSYNLNNIK